MESALTIIAGAVALLLIYLGLAGFLARRWRIAWPTVETLTRELPTPGHHIALFHLPPDRVRFHEPVILCHGLGANRFNVDFLDDGTGRDRSSLARALCRAGFDVWILELRGHGLATVPPDAEWTVDDQVKEDIGEAVQTVLNLTEASSVLWVGHSWGGVLQVLFQVRQEPLADRVKAIVAIGSPFKFGMQPSLEKLSPLLRQWIELTGAGLPLRRLAWLALPLLLLWPRWPRGLAAPVAPLMPGTVRGICASMTEDIPVGLLRQVVDWVDGEIVGAPAGGDREPDYGRLTTPTLLVAGAKDHLAPPAAMAYLRDRAGEEVALKIMGRGTGCAADYGHGGLLLSDRAPDEVFPLIRAWLAARATPVRRRKTPVIGGYGRPVQGGFDKN